MKQTKAQKKVFDNPTQVIAMGVLAVALVGCGSSASNPAGADLSGTTTKLAVETEGSAVQTTSSDQVASNPMKKDSAFASIMKVMTPISEAFAGAFGACPSIIGGSAAGGTCAANGSDQIDLTFSSLGCTVLGVIGPIWVGGSVITAGGTPDSHFACGSGTFPGVNSTMTSITRTTTGNLLASPTSVTGPAGLQTVAIDTSAPTATTFGAANSASPTAGTIGYSYAISGGGGFERSYVSATDHNLTVTARLVGYLGSTTSGPVDYDHTLSTTDATGLSTPLNIQLANGEATVNGTLNLQHNLLKLTATSQFNDVVHETGCCYPISGKVVTTFSNGVNANMTESMTFSAATCALATLGQVSFTNANGDTSTISLDHCF